MINVHNKGIKARLQSNSALIAALGGAAIYFLQAPVNTALPYVIFAIAAGGDVNDSPKPAADLRYNVKAVAADALTANTLADMIRDTLHEAPIDLDGNWGAYRCQHLEAFSYVENVDRKQFWHAGGTYRLRSQYVG